MLKVVFVCVVALCILITTAADSEPEVQCQVLRTDTNRGKFIIQYENERRVNSKARYTCEDSSKKLVGESDRKCLENGKWSGTYPTCEDFKDASDYSLRSDSFGDDASSSQKDVVIPKEADDFDEDAKVAEDSQDSVRTEPVDNVTPAGQENEEIPEHKDQNDDEISSNTDDTSFTTSTTKKPKRQRGRNGDKKKNKNNSNEPLRTESDVDIELSTIQPRTISLDDDDEIIAENNKDFCPPPPEIVGAIARNIEDTEYPVGTVFNYQCPFGHVSQSSSSLRSVCRFDERTGKAEWTLPNIICIPRSCGDPGYVSNGRRIGNLFTFPNKVEFECQEGFKIRGLRARYCQVGGEWSGKLPVCEPIYCSAPSDPVNGRAVYSSLEYGTELEYECNKGFMLQNYEPRFCSEDGTWSNNEPECIETRCQVPEAPAHGTVQVTADPPKVGSLAIYSCDEGATLVGAFTSKCLSTGDWTFNPKCYRSCKISAVQNGELGIYRTIRINTHRTRQEFIRYQEGESIKHNETVIIKCRAGFAPGNQIRSTTDEVACLDGTWSKTLKCEEQRCSGDPPRIENGEAVVGERVPGATIWYKCYDGYDKTRSGRVACNRGKWEGPTPVCSDRRCFLNQLNYPGLIKQVEPFILHGKGFDIECEEGYRKSTSKKRIMCSNTQLDIRSNPCTPKICDGEPPSLLNGNPRDFGREHGSEVDYECDQYFEIAGRSSVRCQFGDWVGQPPVCNPPVKNMETTKSWNTEESSESTSVPVPWVSLSHRDDCFCNYDYRKDLLLASVGDIMVEDEAKVKRGDRISFQCLYPRMDLVWPNGLRFKEKVDVICNTCQDWQMLDLPYCETTQPGDSYIVYSEDMKFLPGGRIELPKTGRFTLKCRNEWAQPKWIAGNREGIAFYQDVHSRALKNGYYTSYMIIGHLEYEHSGRYQCYAEDHYRVYRSVTVDLEITEPEVQCQELQTNTNRGNFIIQYENERRVNSKARYICEDNSKELVGESELICLENGIWSGTYPACEALCPKLNGNDIFLINYTNNRRINSAAYYFCKDSKQRVIGSSNRTCLHNRRWSGKSPTCEEPEVQCQELQTNTNRGNFIIQYENERRVNSKARYICEDNSKELVGESVIICLENGIWSGTYPACEALCPPLNGNDIFLINYTNNRRINSAAYYYCKDNKQRVIGSSNRTCLHNRRWSGKSPTCEDITCLEFHTYNGLIVSYSDELKVDSLANFQCSPHATLVGSDSSRCRFNGTWSHARPACEHYVTCDTIVSVPDLEVSYSNGVRVGSVATFKCSSSTTLIGSTYASCRNDGTWSQSIPTCKIPDCSIDVLMQFIPQGVIPDMRAVTTEYVSPGSELPLLCEDGLILTGTSKAKCDSRGSWDYENVQCVPGCLLSKEISPLLMIDSVKKYYRFGEFVLLSCPPGHKLSSGVERLVCLGKGWSHAMPNCTEWKETSPSGFRGTTKKSR